MVSTAAFHARARGSVPGHGGLNETKNVSSLSTCESQYCGSLRDREVACSTSDRQGWNFESCVWRTVSSQSSHLPQEVLLAQFNLYVHKGGLKPDSFHFIWNLNDTYYQSEGQAWDLCNDIWQRLFCETQWRHWKPFWMGTRWKQNYIRPPPPYFIVLASSVTTMEFKAIEFHRINLLCLTTGTATRARAQTPSYTENSSDRVETLNNRCLSEGKNRQTNKKTKKQKTNKQTNKQQS